MANSDILKSVKDLIYEFIIPSYQRGYRWTQLEVEKLLDDVYGYDKNVDGEFYCLQPLVVKYDNNNRSWRVIDAQQRLTTIYLVLKCLDENIFTITYERDTKISKYRESIDDNDDIELYFIKKNFEVISSWFKNKDANTMRENLLNNTKFIWYDIDVIPGSDEHQMFRNLNSGKIPLTNAELVKALFLKNIPCGNDNNGNIEKELKQNIIAEEYDQIERKMREPDFWYFLTNEKPRTSCIELLFDLMFDVDEIDGNKRNEINKVGANKTFYYFDWIITTGKTNNRLDSSEQFEKVKEEWEKVQETFHILEGWFADAEVYNLIGYLRACNYQLKNIYRLYKGLDADGENIPCRNKTEFINQLKLECLKRCLYREGKKIIPSVENLSNSQYFHYEKEKENVNRILLMHNIATLNLQNSKSDKDKQGDGNKDKKARKDKLASKVKFSFASFHTCGWNVEHISPNNAIFYPEIEDTILWKENDKKKKIPDDSKELLKQCKKGGSKLKDLYDENIKWFEELDKYISIKESSIMTLPNLTLLNEHDNKSVSNKSFKEKRKSILEFQRNGSFVPPATLMVFTKGYSKELDKDKLDFWGEDDRKKYIENMSSTLINYFGNIKENSYGESR